MGLLEKIKIVKKGSEVCEEITTYKEWYKSKTIWFNVVMLGALILQEFKGIQVSDQDVQNIVLGIVAIVNIVLRLTTSKPIAR